MFPSPVFPAVNCWANFYCPCGTCRHFGALSCCCPRRRSRRAFSVRIYIWLQRGHNPPAHTPRGWRAAWRRQHWRGRRGYSVRAGRRTLGSGLLCGCRPTRTPLPLDDAWPILGGRLLRPIEQPPAGDVLQIPECQHAEGQRLVFQQVHQLGVGAVCSCLLV